MRARIVERIDQHQNAMEKHPALTKFCCEVGEEQQEAVFAYGQILQHLEEDLEAEGVEVRKGPHAQESFPNAQELSWF